MVAMARAEREALADTLLRLGPDTRTLCAGWFSADLAAHLVIRDADPVAAAGIVLKPLAGYTARRQQAVRDKQSFEKLVQTVRTGPPAWSPLRVGAVDEAANTIEFFVHHEDLLRGADPDAPPRALSPELSEALWTRLRRMARLAFRPSPVGVTLVRAEAPDQPHRTQVAKPANPAMVTVSGPAGELVLFATGRKDAARVELTGDQNSIDRLRAAKLGI